MTIVWPASWRQRFLGSAELMAQMEHRQTSIRFVLGGIVAAYIWLLVGLGVIDRPTSGFVMLDMVQFFAIAALIFVWARWRPGVNHWRRGLAMALDYGSTGFLIGVAGATMTPIFFVLVWITVGYGIRYGRTYLMLGTALALACILAVATFSAYWQELPYTLITVALMVLLVPGYAHSLTAAMRIAHDEALRANMAKSRFLAQASHDLRQPIHAIGLFTSCLKASTLSLDQKDMVNNIDRALNGVSGLFKSLLDVATLDSGRIVPRIHNVALAPLLHDIVAQHSDPARRANMDLRVVDSALRVQTDSTILTAIISNLVSNAIKYAPGRAAVIGCRRRGGQISVFICDNGPGIQAADRPRVFEEFYRSPQHRRTREGIGLGLSIVARMARLLRVDVTLRSVPGCGTSVEVSGLEPALGPAPMADAPQVRPSALAGMRILLIEDHDEVRAATRTMLESWGCLVRDDPSAQAPAQECDLILADQDLEDGTGGAAIDRIRATLDRRVPAIIMSGHDAVRIAEELDDKTLPILSKPVSPARLRAAIMAQKFAIHSDAPT